MHEITNPLTLLGLFMVLVQQGFLTVWLSRAHHSNTQELEGIKAELVECRARWESVQLEIGRTREAIRLLLRRNGHEGGSSMDTHTG